MLIYLASYPRSGNSWSRSIVKHYFKVQTYTIYTTAARQTLVAQFGHGLPAAAYVDNPSFLIPPLRRRLAATDKLLIVKTHEPPFTEYFAGEKVIHIVRHPGAALWSYYHYLRDVDGIQADIPGLIQGNYGFGSWSLHTRQWLAAGRALGPHYLRYSYEQLHENNAGICTALADFFEQPLQEPLGSAPNFAQEHQRRPHMARRGSPDEWQSHFTPAHHQLLVTVHGAAMQELGYAVTMPVTTPAVHSAGTAAPLANPVKESWVDQAWRKFKPKARSLRWRGAALLAHANLWERATHHGPLVLHITHHKAGSQWVAEIFKQCAPPGTVVLPQPRVAHFTPENLRAGAVIPTIYYPRDKVEAVTAHFTGPIRRFVVMRDLRDTLVSLYFSARYSHPARTLNQRLRRALLPLDQEAGMLALLTQGIPFEADGLVTAPVNAALVTAPSSPGSIERIAHLQRSWLAAPDCLLVRYEELVADEQATFQRIMDYCQIGVAPKRLRTVVANNSFAAMTGRQPGEEDMMAHARKGIVGDWRNYFTDEIKALFKDRYGEHLIATGYEQDLAW